MSVYSNVIIPQRGLYSAHEKIILISATYGRNILFKVKLKQVIKYWLQHGPLRQQLYDWSLQNQFQLNGQNLDLKTTTSSDKIFVNLIRS